MSDFLSGLGSSFLGGVGTSLLGIGTSAIQNSQARRFFDYQFDKMNEYNHPVNQVKRLQQAGLSPWIINGQSIGASAPSAQASAGIAPQIDIGSSKLAFAQAKKIEADANQTEQQTDQNAIMFNYLLDNARLENVFNRQSLMLRLDNLANSNELQNIDVELKKQAFSFASQQNPLLLQQLTQNISNLKKDYDLKSKDLTYKEYQNQIAKVSSDIARQYGILPTDDGFKALIHILLSDKGDFVIDKLSHMIPSLGESLVEGTSNMFSDIKNRFVTHFNNWRREKSRKTSGSLKLW